jgi:hypothetical protein
MPIYKIQGPGGKIYQIEGPEGASDDALVSTLKAHLAEEAKPKSGSFLEAGLGGIKRTLATGQTALEAPFGADEAARRGLARSQAITERPGASLEDLKRQYEQNGLLGAGFEAIKQIPGAIAEQAPFIAGMAAGARYGATIGSAFGPVGTAVGGVGGAALLPLIQAFGGNIERQAAEKQQAGQPIQGIETGRAALAAVPQAAIDVGVQRLVFGKELIGKVLGRDLTNASEKALASEAKKANKLAGESIKRTLATGTLHGALAEIPGEISQQMLERWQAGKDLFDEDAQKEYVDTAYSVGLLAPLGAAGRFSEKAAAQEGIAAKQQEEAAKQKAEQDALLAQRKQLEALGAGYGAGAGQAEGPVKLQRDYESARQKVQELHEQIAEAAATGDLAKVSELDASLKQQEEALAALQAQAKESGVEFKTKFDRADVESQIKKLQAQLQKAGESGDVEKIRKLAPQLAEAQERLKAFSFEMGMEKQAAEKERAEIDAKLASEQELKDREELLAQQAAATEQRPPLELPERPNLDVSEVEAVFEQKFKEYLAKGMPRDKAIAEATKRSETVRANAVKKYQAQLDKYNAKVEALKEAALTPEERLARSQEDYEDATETARKNSFVDDIFDEIGNAIQPTGPISTIKISDDIQRGRPIGHVINEFQDEQNTSYFNLMNLAQQLRNRDFIGGEGGIRGRELISMQDVRKNLEADIEETKKQYINAVLYRAAAERAALGRSGLDEDTALKLATQTKALLDELVTRTSAPTTRVYQKEAFKRGEEEMGEDTRIAEERRFTYDDAALDRLQKLYGLDDTVMQYIRQFNKRLGELDAQRDQKLSPEVRRKVVAEFNRTFQQRAETLNEGLMRSVEKNIRGVVADRGQLTAVEGPLKLTAPSEEGLAAKEARLKGEATPDRTRPVREAGDIDMEIDAKRRELEFVKSQTTAGPGLGLYGAPTTVFNKPTEIARLEREIEELQKKKSETVPGTKPSLAGQLLRRREFTANKINDLLKLRGGEFDTATLNALDKVQTAAENGTATNELLDLADEAIARKGGATVAAQIEDELKNIQQVTQEGKQADLFGATATERTTPARLRALSESEQRKAAEKEAKTPEAKLKALQQEVADIEKELEGLAPKEKQAVVELLAQAKAAEREITNNKDGFEKKVTALKVSLEKVRADREKAKKSIVKLNEKIEKLSKKLEELLSTNDSTRSNEVRTVSSALKKAKTALRVATDKVNNYVEPTKTNVKPGAEQSDQNILDLKKEREALLASGAKEGSAQVLSIDRAIANAEERKGQEQRPAGGKAAPRGKEIIPQHWPLEFESQLEQVYSEAVDTYESIIQQARELASMYRAAAQREVGGTGKSPEAKAAAAEQSRELLAKKTEIKGAIRALVLKIRKKKSVNASQQIAAERTELANKRAADAALAGAQRLLAETQTKADRLAEQARLESVGRQGVRVTSEVVYGKTGQMYTVSTEETKLLRQKRDELSRERKALKDAGKKNSKEYNKLDSEIADLSIQIATKETPLQRRVVTPVAPKKEAGKVPADILAAERNVLIEDKEAEIASLKNARTPELKQRRARLEKELRNLKLESIFGPAVVQDVEKLIETKGISVDKATAIQRALTTEENRIKNALKQRKETKPASRFTAKEAARLKEIEALRAELNPLLEEAVGAAATLRRQERVTAVNPRAPTPQVNFVAKAAREHSLSTSEATEVVLTAQSRTGVQSALRKYGANSAQYTKAMNTAVAAEVKERAKQTAQSFEDTDSVIDIRSGISWRMGPVAETPVSEAAAKSAADGLKLPKGVKFVYSYTYDGLPQSVKDVLPNKAGARGAILPDGTVVVIGDRHASVADLETTAVHELVGHYGVDMLLGESGMKALTKNIEAQSGGIAKLAEELGPEVAQGVALTKAGGGDAVEQVRELIAYTAQQRATEGFLKKANRFIKELVGTLRASLKKMGFTSFGLDRVSTSDIYKIIRDAEQTLGKNRPGVYVSPTGQAAFRLGGEQWANTPQAQTMKGIAKGGIIGKEKGLVANIKANLFGLAGVTQWLDRLAPVERAAAYMKDEAQAMQMMYHLRMSDYANNATSEVATNGPLTYEKDEKGYYKLTTKEGPSLAKIAEVLNGAKPTFGNANAVNEAFSLYMAAVRARQEKKNTLDYEERHITKEELDAAFAAGDSEPAFREARKMYKQYNEGLLNFLVETGAMSEKERDRLIKDKEYFPFYRMRNGNAELVIGEELAPLTVGNLKNQPHLQQLIGGTDPILDFYTGALQNTRLLTEMAMRNQATKETAFAFANSGLLDVPLDDKGNPKLRKDGKPFNGIFKGDGPTSPNVIRFKHNGDNYYAMMNQKQLDAIGIPADLLVKGMEGIRATIPAFFRAMSVPTRWLRLAITRNPVYVARQITRDSTNNWLTTGADDVPVLGATKEYISILRGKSEGYKALQKGAILGGQTLTGMPEDMQKILLQITNGEGGRISKLAAMADRYAAASDAASRVRIYNSFRKQGLSDMEAQFATMESMNYNKRGLSPSLYMANMMIPFLYSQIQGLNVTYKAMFGKMPFAQKLNQKSKFWTRGMMLTACTLAYAAMMDDDEAYENAGPEKYSNWFVYIPGMNEPLRIPIPFEVGTIFKAIPEATIDMIKGGEDSKKAVKGMQRLLMQSVPGDIPTFMKPGIEVMTNYSFYNDQPIVSRREQQFLPAEQYRESTTEFAKFLGSVAGVSPIKVDYFIRGHMGSLGIATMQAMNLMALDKPDVEPPTGRASTLPIVGALFQPKDASGSVEVFYETADRLDKTKATFNKMVTEGRSEDAVKFAQENSRELALVDLTADIKKEMGELAAMRRLVLQSALSGPEKRERMDDIRKAQIGLSKAVNQAFYSKQ